jgi:hypothetical protein
MKVKKVALVSKKNFFIVKSKPSNWRKLWETKRMVAYRGCTITHEMDREMKKLPGGIWGMMGSVKLAVKPKPGYILKYA